MNILVPSLFAPALATPFPHRVVQPALKPSLFDELDRTFPGPDWFAESEVVHGGRRDFAIESDGTGRGAEFLRGAPAWARLWEEVASPSTRHALLGCFAGQLEARGYVGGDSSTPDFAFSIAGPGYEVPVHHDKRYHVAALMLYMSGHVAGSGGELVLYRSLRSGPSGGHPRFPRRSEVEPIRAIEPLENTGCLLLNTADAYHSVAMTRAARRFVYVAWNVEQHSAWKLSAQARWVPGNEFASQRKRRGFFEHG